MRPTAHEVFMNMAIEASRRATCSRASVGCVLSYQGNFASAGYNGSPKGKPHCTEAGCWMVEGHCKRAIHAENNAIARLCGRPADTAYITHLPCLECCQLLHQHGILLAIYQHPYRMDEEKIKMIREIYNIEIKSIGEI